MENKNYGTLSANKYKKQDSHPDFKGSVTINGVKWELAGWKKQGNDGAYISLQAKIPREQQNAFKTSQNSQKDDFLDDILNM